MEKYDDKTKHMQDYELMYILPAKLSDEEKQAVMDRVNLSIDKFNGKVKDHNIWMTRKLSYSINHIRQGLFILAHFSIPGESLNKLRRELDLDEDIIRHLITSYDPSKKPSFQTPRPIETRPSETAIPEKEKDKPEEKVVAEELDKKLEEILSDET